MVQALVEEVQIAGLVEGTAVQRHYVYEEQFGKAGADEANDDTASSIKESAYGVRVNMYASRVHMDNVDHLLDFMVASGLSEDALLSGIERNTLKGLPPPVTVKKVKQYFRRIGKDADQLEAELTVGSQWQCYHGRSSESPTRSRRGDAV